MTTTQSIFTAKRATPTSTSEREEQRIVALSLALSLVITLAACLAGMSAALAR